MRVIKNLVKLINQVLDYDLNEIVKIINMDCDEPTPKVKGILTKADIQQIDRIMQDTVSTYDR